MQSGNGLNKIPRVTEILRCHSGYEYIKKDVLERAAARGTSVHALCAGIAKGNWIPDSMIADEFLGYIKSFRQWHEAQVKEFVIIEKRYTDIFGRFSGQLDFVVEGTDNKLYLVDLKTSASPQKTHYVQMGAYSRLLNQNNIQVEGAMLIYLDKNGEFPEIKFIHDMREEYNVFISALECYEYFKLRKVKDE